jgi:hypothetical protein
LERRQSQWKCKGSSCCHYRFRMRSGVCGVENDGEQQPFGMGLDCVQSCAMCLGSIAFLLFGVFRTLISQLRVNLSSSLDSHPCCMLHAACPPAHPLLQTQQVHALTCAGSTILYSAPTLPQNHSPSSPCTIASRLQVYHGGAEHLALQDEAFKLFNVSNPLHGDIW